MKLTADTLSSLPAPHRHSSGRAVLCRILYWEGIIFYIFAKNLTTYDILRFRDELTCYFSFKRFSGVSNMLLAPLPWAFFLLAIPSEAVRHNIAAFSKMIIAAVRFHFEPQGDEQLLCLFREHIGLQR